MSSKAGLLLASVVAGLLVLVSGCAPSANLSLQFSPATAETYEVTTETTKDFRFEQPSLNKLLEEQSTTVITIGFTQTVMDVDNEGIAAADVRIDALSVFITNKNEERLSFDSAREADRANPLYNLIGQRYAVRISPEGKVVGFDASAAKRAGVGGFEARMAEGLLNEDGIRQRHEIPALWGFGQNTAINQTWSKVVPSPPGLLAPKNYRKVYTLTDVQTRDGQKVAVVAMNAGESGEAANAAANAMGMGIFARMFDSQDEYTGTLLLNLDTGSVLEYDETLVSTYLAQEMPAHAPADKGPDTLTMRFTHRVTMTKR